MDEQRINRRENADHHDEQAKTKEEELGQSRIDIC